MVVADKWIKSDKRIFQERKERILAALQGSTGIINGVTEDNKEQVFYMLMFCLCVPQSKAVKAEEAIDKLRDADFYHQDLTLSYVSKILTSRVRFQHTKAHRLMKAKVLFLSGGLWAYLRNAYEQYQQLTGESKGVFLRGVRSYLSDKVDGIGYKVSGHFLRNIGMSGLAILDVHVIIGLKRRGIIDKEPKSKDDYVDVEAKMMAYAAHIGLSVDELDLLLWSQRTGYVFK